MNPRLAASIKKYFDNYSGIPATCWGAIILTFIQSLAIGICYFLSLYFVSALHVNIATAGIMLSCYGAGTIIGGIVSGKLSDRFSPKTIAIISLMIQSMSFVLLAQLESIHLLMMNLFVLGLSVYGFKTSNDIWMLSECGLGGGYNKLRVKAINISRVAMNLGLGLSGVIIGLFAQYGFKPIFYTFGAMLFLSSLYLCLQRRQEITPRASEARSLTEKPVIQNTSLLLLTLFCLFCVGLMIAQLGSTYPVYLIDTFPAMGMRAVSILYLLDTFLIVFAQAPLTNALSNFNKILVMGIGAFLMGAGMLILSISSVFSLAILSCLVWTTGEMLFMPMAQLLCYEHGGDKKKGQALGLFQATYASSAVIGPAAGGFIYYHSNGDNVWYLCGLFGVICFGLCLQAFKAASLSSRLYTNTAAQKG